MMTIAINKIKIYITMDIYNLLPSELQNKVKYYVLEHPAAKIIKEEIERIRCDEYYVFRD